MTDQSVSVIIVSRDRPAALERCILGLEQLFFQGFELVIVADSRGVDQVKAMGLERATKLVPFDTPNISSARNIGLSWPPSPLALLSATCSCCRPVWRWLRRVFLGVRAGGFVEWAA